MIASGNARDEFVDITVAGWAWGATIGVIIVLLLFDTATPLFAVLLLVEAIDVLFAVDSVPAVLAVSKEQFIVFTSNAFAIMGLRSLYFMLADMHARFSYLQQGLAIILAFVGIKMLLIGKPFELHMPTYVSLSVIAIVIAAAVIASLRADKRDRNNGVFPSPHRSEEPRLNSSHQ